MRLDVADFADLDGERLGFASLQWQRSSRQDKRHLVAGFEILRATYDLALALAVIDAADGELVRIGMLVARDDLRHHDAVEFTSDLVDAFDLKAEHREPLAEFLG